MHSRNPALLGAVALCAIVSSYGTALAATVDSVNAKYDARKGEVKINGELAAGSPATLLRVYDDLTNNLLASGTFSGKYKFTLEDSGAYPVPCAVRVEAGDAPRRASVRDAPADCSQFEGTSVTLSGVVRDNPIPFATVTVTVGGVNYTTVADANGEFVIEIAGIDLSSLVLIESSGANPQDESQTVDLVSVAGTLAKLVEDADGDGIVDGTENPNINNTPYTTALFVLLVEANGGETPETLEELQSAERSVDASELLQLAAVIKLLVDDPNFDLPEGYATIIEFLSDPSLDGNGNTPVDNFIADNQEAVDTATEAILEDSGITPAFNADEIPDRYYAIRPAQAGFISRQGQALEFNADFTGRTLESFIGEPQPGVFTWAVTDGRLVMEFTEPPIYPYYTAFPATETLRCQEPDNDQFLTCPHTCQDYLNAFAQASNPGNPIAGTNTPVQRAFTRYGISAGGTREFVQVEEISVRDYPPFDYETGSGSASFEFCDEYVSNVGHVEFVNADTNPPLQLAEAGFAGKTLAIPVYYDPDAPDGGFTKGLRMDLVTLTDGAADGEGFRPAETLLSTETDPDTQLPEGLEIEWRISEGGGPAVDGNGDRLELRYSGGELQTMRQIDPALDVQTGYFTELHPGGNAEPFGFHDIVIEVDPAFSLATGDYMVNAPGEVWLGMINAWAKDQWVKYEDGTYALPQEFVFGWEFLVGGAGKNHSVYFDAGQYWSFPGSISWLLLASDTVVSPYLNPVPANTLRITRPNGRARYWLPIARTTIDTPNAVENASAQRERFYNLEFEFLGNGSIWIAPRINSEEIFYFSVFPPVQ